MAGPPAPNHSDAAAAESKSVSSDAAPPAPPALNTESAAESVGGSAAADSGVGVGAAAGVDGSDGSDGQSSSAPDGFDLMSPIAIDNSSDPGLLSLKSGGVEQNFRRMSKRASTKVGVPPTVKEQSSEAGARTTRATEPVPSGSGTDGPAQATRGITPGPTAPQHPHSHSHVHNPHAISATSSAAATVLHPLPVPKPIVLRPDDPAAEISAIAATSTISKLDVAMESNISHVASKSAVSVSIGPGTATGTATGMTFHLQSFCFMFVRCLTTPSLASF